jgi:hypothetical protein
MQEILAKDSLWKLFYSIQTGSHAVTSIIEIPIISTFLQML